MPKRYFIRTYGCQMNYHDSERLSGLLEEAGYERAETAEQADVVLINTCAVREKPERKLFAELEHLKKVRKTRPQQIQIVAGCMAPRDGEIIRQRSPHLELLLGPRSLHHLPELLEEIQNDHQRRDEIALDDDPTPFTPTRRTSAVTAWVDVQFGCNYACSYCAVPSARGGEVSRSPRDILAEIDRLSASGYREVMLLGQTVNGYGRDRRYRFSVEETGWEGSGRQDFAWLLEQIDRRAPELRVRYASPHPQLFSDRLINKMGSLATVCEHVHLPLQSGDNRVLRRMRRSYTLEKYRRVVDKMREITPEIVISTDIIVGFPGETEEQFQNTLQAIVEIGFEQAFMFAYSPRRKTEAFSFPDEIPPEIQKRRLKELIEIANAQFHRKNEPLVGRTLEVLVEGVSESNPDRLSGRTRSNKTVVFEGSPTLIGKLVHMRATKAYLWGVKADLITSVP